MMGVISFNVVIILLGHYPSNTQWERLYLVTNYFFLLIFLCEAVFKIAGLGPRGYLKVRNPC